MLVPAVLVPAVLVPVAREPAPAPAPGLEDVAPAGPVLAAAA
jgi:hypothetical protein